MITHPNPPSNKKAKKDLSPAALKLSRMGGVNPSPVLAKVTVVTCKSSQLNFIHN